MARGTNLEHTRQYNRRAVLAALRRMGVASRTEIAGRTGLSLTAVSSIVDELVRDGWLAAQGRRTTARGQPPIDFALADGGAFGIGVAFDRDQAAAALVDLSGRLLAEQRLEVDEPAPEDAVACAHELVRGLLAGLSRAERERVLGLGVTVPGVVDPRGRVERMIRLPSWEGADPAGRFASAAGLPVTMTNDAVAAALGESSFGTGRAGDTLCYVLFALGLGSSLMMDGRPHRGLWGVSGRLGHIPVRPEGPPCPACGGRGCLSLYASVETLEERLAVAPGDGDVARRFRAGDEVAHAWVEEAADAFARAMLVLENLLAPDELVLDGRIPGEVLHALVARAAERHRRLRPRRPDRPPMVLRIGSHGAAAASFGAATLPLYLATAVDLELVR